MKDNYVIVLGTGCVDSYYKIKTWPELGESVVVEDMGKMVGGIMLNAAGVIGGLGCKVKPLDIIPSSTEGTKMCLEFYKEKGIDTSGIFFDESGNNSACDIFVTDSGERTIIVHPQVYPQNVIGDNWIELASNASYLYTYLGGFPRFPSQTEIVRVARENGTTIVCDCGSAYLEQWEIDAILNVDVVIHNRFSYEKLSDYVGEDAAQYLLSRGAKIVYRTMDKEGCEVYYDGRCEKIPTLDVKVVDTTGAGDTFSGSIVYCLSQGKDPFEAARFGNIAASRAVTILGATAGACSAEEVYEFMAEYEKSR